MHLKTGHKTDSNYCKIIFGKELKGMQCNVHILKDEEKD